MSFNRMIFIFALLIVATALSSNDLYAETVSVNKFGFYYVVDKKSLPVNSEEYYTFEGGLNYIAFYSNQKGNPPSQVAISISAKSVKGHTQTMQYNLYNNTDKFFYTSQMASGNCKLIDRGKLPYGYKDGAYAIYSCVSDGVDTYIYHFGTVLNDSLYNTMYILPKSQNDKYLNQFENIRKSIVIK